MAQLVHGDTVARYRVAGLIARGGMGEVYRATDVESGRPVALKLFAASGDGRFGARFERERAIAAVLDHPRIVPIYATGVDDAGRAYIAMRLVEGRDLASVLRDGPLALERAIAIGGQVAEALDAAHDRGLVHRDVKPGNILLEARADGGDDVFLSDFGLVKELVVDDGLSTTGAVLGTPEYMPPELVLSGGSDARGDVYALGCVLFEMLTGRTPFHRESEVATIWAHVNDDPPSPTELVPGLPAGLDVVIARALAKEPEDRFASAGDLAAAARATASGAPSGTRPRPRSTTDVCPYKGLASFDEADAAFFFGREELVEQLVPRLRESGFLAVVGASGSGKSSLVRAGLLPALGEPAAIITPGERPLDALAGAVPGSVLVVDQFEELFTLCADETGRETFVGRALSCTDDVVIVVRADFYDRCLAYPELASRLERCQAAVGPMSEEALRRAITKPAQRVGLHLEHRLLETIVHDVAGQPGALPLLSHALLETWNRRVGRTLTLAGYLEAGGVEGALARTAQALYDEHDAADRQLLRGVFLRLTKLGEGTEDTRRRVSFAELVPRASDEERVRALVQRLVDARLVTVDGTSVEVAHEALIRHWPTLRAWLQQDRDGRRVHRRITESAQEWTALDRDPGVLLRGGRLAAAAEWAELHDDELNEQERDFVAASTAAEAQELASVRRRNRRLRVLVVALAVLLAAAAVAAVIAVRQTGEAQDQQAEATRQAAAAEEQSLIARSRALAGQSQALLSSRLDQALLVALESARVADIPESRDALVAAVQRTSGIEAILGREQSSASAIAVSRAGDVVIVGDATGSLTGWNLETGAQTIPPFRLTAGGAAGGLIAVAISPDAGSVAGITTAGAVWRANVREPHEPVRLAPVSDSDWYFGGRRWEQVAFTDDGSVMAVSALDQTSTRLDAALVRWFTGPRRVDATLTSRSARGVALSPNGAVVALADGDGIAVYTATGTLVRRLPWQGGRVDGPPLLQFSADGGLLAAVSGADGVAVWDVKTGAAHRYAVPRASRPTAIAITPDSARLVVGFEDGSVRVVDLATGDTIGVEFGGHAATVSVIAATSRGKIVSVGGDGLVLRWSATGESSIERSLARASTDVATTADGALLAIARSDDTVELVPTADGSRPTALAHVAAPAVSAFSPDGRHLAVSDGDGRLRIWDVTRRRPGARSAEVWGGAPIAFSADGRFIAARGRPGTGNVDVWRAGERRATILQSSLPRVPLALTFAPDSKRLAIGFNDGSIRIVDPADLEQPGRVVEAHVGAVTGVAFNADGTILASVGGDGTLRYWSTLDGSPRGATPSGGARLGAVAYAEDGRVVVTLGDRGLQFWDSERRVALGAGLPFEPGETTPALDVPASGRRAIVTWNGQVVDVDGLVWTDDVARLAGRVCELVGRSLTPEEFAQFEPDEAYAEQCDGRSPRAR